MEFIETADNQEVTNAQSHVKVAYVQRLLRILSTDNILNSKIYFMWICEAENTALQDHISIVFVFDRDGLTILLGTHTGTVTVGRPNFQFFYTIQHIGSWNSEIVNTRRRYVQATAHCDE